MDASKEPALLFDLDGTLIHRRVGMSNGLLVNALAREMGREFSAEQVAALQAGHARVFRELAPHVRPLPGAVELLSELSQRGVLWAIATSGTRATAGPNLAKLGFPPSVPIVTRDEVWGRRMASTPTGPTPAAIPAAAPRSRSSARRRCGRVNSDASADPGDRTT
ncbi:MAG: HAD family hydrolase [Candidatus Dormibacteria bacterium]